MAATGTLTLDGRSLAVEGSAWFDHQWGDFISVGAGGWDWFAMNLDDGTDVTLSLVRDTEGRYPLVYGTAIDRAGRATHLGEGDFVVEPTGSWTSPATKATYPSGWRVRIPGLGLELRRQLLREQVAALLAEFAVDEDALALPAKGRGELRDG